MATRFYAPRRRRAIVGKAGDTDSLAPSQGLRRGFSRRTIVTQAGGDSAKKRRMILPVTDESLARAKELLQRGEVVAFPTETVYGLGAHALSAEAVARIYEVKGRP